MNDLASIIIALGVARQIKMVPGVKYMYSYLCV